MKLLFLLFPFFAAHSNIIDSTPQVALAYTLTMKTDTMHVQLQYQPVIPDSTTFQYGNLFYGGMKDLMKSFIHLQSSVAYKVDSGERKIIFYYRQNQPVNIEYDIIDTHTPEQKVVGEMFRPIITKDYFFSLSHTLFLNPQWKKEINDSACMSVTIGSNPAFPLYCSFAPELKNGGTAVIKLNEGMDALVTGASDLHIEKREMNGIKNYVVLRINPQNSYNLKRFMDYFDKFLPAMNNFWGNLNGNFYSLIAAKFQNINYHKISGTAFNHGFHVKYSGDTVLADDEVIYTISHEIMHRYIGTGCVSLKEEENQWFDEGFTDYTTWYLVSACGILPEEDFIKQLKIAYKELSENPVRNTPNKDIARHFWENKNYEKLPYRRGALFAAYISKKIKQQHNGKNFGDFMRALKTFAEYKKEALTVNDFITVASRFMPGQQIKTALDEYIMQGKMIPEKDIF